MRLIDADTMYDCKTCYHDSNGKCQLGTFGCDHGEAYRPAFSKLEIVDAVPVVYGQWILEREPNGRPYCFHCSVCDGDFHHIGIKSATKYCPNCGAKMDLE